MIPVPDGYEIVETSDPVAGVDPIMVTWFRWRADRCAERANRQRIAPSFRYIVRGHGRRWKVVAYQNVLRPIDDQGAVDTPGDIIEQLERESE